MTNDLSTRVRLALEPTTGDQARADAILQNILATGSPSGDAPQRRRWTTPAAAAAAALLLSAGVAAPGLYSHQSTAPGHASSATDNAQTGNEHVDLQAWARRNFPTLLDSTDAASLRPPLVAMRTAPWCPPCGGKDFMQPVLAAAKAQPRTRFLILVPAVSRQEINKLRRNTPPNLSILPGTPDTPLPGEHPPGSRLTPALVRVPANGARTMTVYGHDAMTTLEGLSA